MKTAVCCYSRRHGNTLRVLEAMAEGNNIDLIDVTACSEAQLEDYDAVGPASGIYFGQFHKSVLRFADNHLPKGKNVFFVYTCGSMGKGYAKAIAEAAVSRGAAILGEYGCRGYDTFGPFRLVGGIAKGHPNAAELQGARAFYASVENGR